MKITDLTQSEYRLLHYPYLVGATNQHLAKRLIAEGWIERTTDRYVATHQGRIAMWSSNFRWEVPFERDDNYDWIGCELDTLVSRTDAHITLRSRIRSCLRTHDIRTVSELRAIGRDELFRWPNLGVKSIELLADATKAFDPSSVTWKHDYLALTTTINAFQKRYLGGVSDVQPPSDDPSQDTAEHHLAYHLNECRALLSAEIARRLKADQQVGRTRHRVAAPKTRSASHG